MARGFGSTLGSGTTDRVVTALTAHATQRTYAVWARKNGNGGSGVGRFFEKRVSGAQVEGFYTGATTNEYFRAFSGGTSIWRIDNTGIAANTWHHLVITYDSGSAGNDPLIYLNGTAVTVTNFARGSGSATNNADAYVLGNRANDNARNWDGLLAEWAVWDRILPATEIAALAKGLSPRRFSASLVEYAPLWGLASPEPIFLATGDGGTATVTGTARANHAPVRPFTWFRPSVFDLGAAPTRHFRRTLLGVGF